MKIVALLAFTIIQTGHRLHSSRFKPKEVLLLLPFSRSIMSDSITPWTVTHQTPLSMGFLKQEYWKGLPFLSPGSLPTPRDQTRISYIGRWILYHWATWEALKRGPFLSKKSFDQLKEIPGGTKGNQKMFRSFIMGFPRKCHHLPSDSRTFPRAVPGDTLSMCYFSPLMSAICFAGTQGPSGKDVWDTQC